MKLKLLEVKGLFGQRDHVIDFSHGEPNKVGPSLIILCGYNGVGKTTILRMLDGLMRLDFNIFRRIPFNSCSLTFDTNTRITVSPHRKESLEYLDVEYGPVETLHTSRPKIPAIQMMLDGGQSYIKVRLHPNRAGPLNEKDTEAVYLFRQTFLLDTEALNFELVDTARILGILYPPEGEAKYLSERELLWNAEAKALSQSRHMNPKAKPEGKTLDLATKIKVFIQEAQVNYRRFFSSTDPDLFPKILSRITDTQQPHVNAEQLMNRLQTVHQQDEISRRFGLEPDLWDYEELTKFLRDKTKEPAADYALTALSVYTETLESHAAERQLIVKRLDTFETLINRFFIDKAIKISPKQGFEITTTTNQRLREEQLGSGEYHLLYLMVAALVTQRRGTVLAIDEPEMSMHLQWQRQLIRAIVECASDAEPQFIFATHSPDIAAEYQDNMIPLGNMDI
jgi:energy-coupling factor transporter ATP-binding protein EcfA2